MLAILSEPTILHAGPAMRNIWIISNSCRSFKASRRDFRMIESRCRFASFNKLLWLEGVTGRHQDSG